MPILENISGTKGLLFGATLAPHLHLILQTLTGFANVVSVLFLLQFLF